MYNLLMWRVGLSLRAKMGKIPVSTALVKRGVKIHSSFCGPCVGDVETADHALVSCSFANCVWMQILKWCGIEGRSYATVGEALDDMGRLSNGSRRKLKMLSSIFYGTLWNLWQARNNRIFNSIMTDPMKVVETIKSMSFLWCKHRVGSLNLDWSNWVLAPLCNL